MLYFARIMLTARTIRMLLASAIVVAIAVLAGIVMNRGPDREATAPAPVAPAENQAEMALKGISVQETTDGRTTWTLIAATANYDTDHARARLTDVRLAATSPDKRVGELILTAPGALYHTETRDVYLSGGVRAANSTGMEFTTRTIRFAGGAALLTTADPVRFSDAELTLEGTGMVYDVERNTLKISKNVTATMTGGKKR